MIDLIDDDGRFTYSKEHSELEYYKCFYDPSNPDSITGEELLRLKEREFWSKENSRVWFYFYRPYNYRNNIAPKQKKWIANIESNIEKLRRDVFFNKLYGIFSFILISLYFIYSNSLSNIIIFPIVLYIVFIFLKIQSINKNILLNENKIYILKNEISHLLDQYEKIKRNRLKPREIEELFWEDLIKLEKSYVKKSLSTKIAAVRGDSRSFYKHKSLNKYKISKYPIYPVIPSWALLQPSQRDSPNINKTQVTGLEIASNEIGKKVATWRNMEGKRPIFRLWYIQFLFFHQKNLSIWSFYYDFITKKIYSQNIESYQYNHITNYSYTDEDISYMNKDPMIEKIRLPEKLTSNIFGNEIKTISLSSASGTYYRCVIPDFDVTDGLNEWLDYNNENEKIDNRLVILNK